MAYYTKTSSDVLKELHTTKHGLSHTEAAVRIKKYGSNTIRVEGDSFWRKLIEPFANAFMAVLAVAIVISLYHGDIFDAVVIGVIMVVNAIIYYIQRFSTERVLRSLQKKTVDTATVLRDSTYVELLVTKLVPGDIIRINEGEKVPADARILHANSFRVNESQLTGEAEPISKYTEAIKGEKEVYDQTNMVFQGTFAVSGEAIAVVTATGNATEFGKLANLTKDAGERSPIQKKIDKLVSQIIAVVAALSVVAFALSLWRGIDVFESLRFVIALAVSAVPESLPVAISVVLVLGMRRMAAKKALVRNMRAIETVGALTTIATDKTGTLTKNKLTVHETWQLETTKKQFDEFVQKSITANDDGAMYDPLDTALAEYSNKEASHTHAPMRVFTFDQTAAMSGTMSHHGSSYHLYIKGSPEHVILQSDLTDNEREKINAQLHKFTAQGYRVIAVAHAELKKPLEELSKMPSKNTLTFDGLVAIADVLRYEAKSAIQAALNAGISVRMITGDHQETAYHIAKELGIVTSRNEVFDCRKLSIMSDDELGDIVDSVRVYSRVTPEHKYRLLGILKKHNITAMTGDGVNDVPALTGAHVGIAMGSGTEMAKDASDIILIDDNFKTIVDAMREGRIILANIRRMLYYLLATNTGEVLTMLGALIINMPLPLVPIQILWVNLVTDTTMVIPLGLEPEQKNSMKSKPLSITAPILNASMITRMIIVALAMAVITLTLYFIYTSLYGYEYGRTIAFTSLVVMQWASAFNARSDYESIFSRLKVMNKSFYVGLFASILLQVLVVFGPLQQALHIAPVAIGDIVISSTVAFLLIIGIVEFHKLLGRKYHTT